MQRFPGQVLISISFILKWARTGPIHEFHEFVIDLRLHHLFIADFRDFDVPVHPECLHPFLRDRVRVRKVVVSEVDLV